MTIQATGEALAAQLYAAESAIDQALGQIALLAAMLPGARSAAHLPATTGQPIFEATSRALASATEARGHLVDAHRRLDILGRRLTFDMESVGPVDKPDDMPPIGGNRPNRAPSARQNLMNGKQNSTEHT